MADKRLLQPSPRWLYTFLNWMRGTPLNGVLVALAIFVVSAGSLHWAVWQSGNLPRYQLDTELLFPALWLPSNILFWLWLDAIARNAIAAFANGIGKSKQETERVYIDFISISEPMGLILLVGGLALGIGDSVTRASAFGVTQLPLVFLMSLGPIVGGVFELFSLFRILRQLALVNALYKSVKNVNLFNLWPIYALSRYGYTIALLFILATVLIDLLFRLLTGTDLGFVYIVYTLIISLVVFLAPLIGINNRLRIEKAHELQRLGDQLDSVYSETEAAVRNRKLSKVPALRNASSALKDQMEAIQKVATWPWNPGSLRNLLLPLLLPLLIAILQRYVLSFLGF
jgi:hypothetical protein